MRPKLHTLKFSGAQCQNAGRTEMFEYAQCGNFRIFLSLTFYVKSVLDILEVEISVDFAFSEALNFHFSRF